MPKLIYRTLALSWCFPLAAIIISLLFWSELPETLAVHFNLSGEADGDLPKWMAIFVLPVTSIVFGLGMFAAAHFRQGIFRDRRQSLVLARICTSFAFLFFGVHMAILLTALKPENFSVNEVVFLTMGIFFVLFGLSTRDLAPNKYIGFTFPWNKNKPRVWARTHDLFYRWFVLTGGLFVLVTVFYPKPEISIVLVFLAVFMPTWLSYRFARKESPNLSYRQKPKQGPSSGRF